MSRGVGMSSDGWVCLGVCLGGGYVPRAHPDMDFN